MDACLIRNQIQTDERTEIMDICDRCAEQRGCDQVWYDCPLLDFRGTPCRFVNRYGEEFISEFTSEANAKAFAERADMRFMGEA